MISVLHVLSDDARRGAQVFGWSLAQRLDEIGVPSTVVALVGGDPNGLPVGHLGTRARGPTTLRALRARMAEVDITVAHGSSTLQACALAGIGPGRPFVYRQISDPVYWSSGTARRLRTHAFYRFPRHVVSLSERTKAVLGQRFSVASGRVTVIPNGVNERAFTEADSVARAAARDQLGLDPQSQVVGFVGALSEEKGVFDLLDVVGPNRVLVMAGDGPARSQLAEKASTRSIDLRMLGPVHDLQTVYAACDVVVLPSWSEQQPAALLEAALVGTPVVATRVGLIDEVVVDGKTGLLVPARQPSQLADAIDVVLALPDRGRAMGAAGRSRVLEQFSIGQVAGSWSQLLTSLVP